MNLEDYNLKMNRAEEKTIIDFVDEYILADPFFKTLSRKAQKETRKTFIVVMRAVFKANNYPNVIPVIFAHSYQAAEVIADAMNKVSQIIPNVERIRIQITN